ncbi:hypothetical protein ACJJTC_000303 [Scirpophaga incertulas]
MSLESNSVSRDKSPLRPKANDETKKDLLSELIRERGIIKGRLTRFANYLDNISVGQLSSQKRIEMKMRIQSANAMHVEFNDLQTKIEKIVRDTDLDAQLTQRDLFEDSYYSVVSQAEYILSTSDITNSSKITVCHTINDKRNAPIFEYALAPATAAAGAPPPAHLAPPVVALPIQKTC